MIAIEKVANVDVDEIARLVCRDPRREPVGRWTMLSWASGQQ